jgi:hypothetical protein
MAFAPLVPSRRQRRAPLAAAKPAAAPAIDCAAVAALMVVTHAAWPTDAPPRDQPLALSDTTTDADWPPLRATAPPRNAVVAAPKCMPPPSVTVPPVLPPPPRARGRQPRIANSNETTCCICLANAVDTMLRPCGHTRFCCECVRIMLSKQHSCPVCKQRVHKVVAAFL